MVDQMDAWWVAWMDASSVVVSAAWMVDLKDASLVDG